MWKCWMRERSRYAWHFSTLARGWPNEKWLITCVASRRTEPTESNAKSEMKKGTNMTKVNLFICAANSYLLLTQYRHVFFCIRPWIITIIYIYILLEIAFACTIFSEQNHFPFRKDDGTAVSVVAVASDRVLIFQLNSNAKSSCSAKTHSELEWIWRVLFNINCTFVNLIVFAVQAVPLLPPKRKQDDKVI